MTTYGHAAALLTGPRCTCGRPVQVREDGASSCARCYMAVAA